MISYIKPSESLHLMSHPVYGFFFSACKAKEMSAGEEENLVDELW